MNDNVIKELLIKYGYISAIGIGLVGLVTLLTSPVGIVILLVAIIIAVLSGFIKGDIHD